MINKYSLSLLLALSPLAVAEKPNVVLFLADDLGYGDVSSYNTESKIQTPNIDSLAADGVSFMDGHSNSAVCTPSRYGTLTGQYAWRTHLKKGVLLGYSRHLIKPGTPTIASELKAAGYNTACIGKWHLGMDIAKNKEKGKLGWDYTQPIKNGPNSVGFDYYLGIAASLDMPPYALIENDKFKQIPDGVIEKIERPLDYTRGGEISSEFKHIYFLPNMVGQATGWITEQAKSDKPFFLYMPLPSPHKPVLPNEQFKGKSGIGDYGDYVMETDWVVGEVLNTLKKLGEYENTLIIMTSDNASFAVPDKYLVTKTGHKVNKDFRGQKTDIFEGGHRVPFIISWPKGYTTNKGKQSHQTISLVDLLATIKNIIDPEQHKHADGVSFNNYLKAELDDTKQLKQATIHHSGAGTFAIRCGDWKLSPHQKSGGRTKIKVKAKGMLYNMKNDPGETTNLYDENPEVVEKLTALLEEIKKSEEASTR